MLNQDNLHDDLKVLFVCSGYFTEEEECGYDELIFAVRKEYLLSWLNGVAYHEIDEDYMERWLREEYTSDDSYSLYQQAKHDEEIVFARPMWNRGDNGPDEAIYERYNDKVKQYTFLLRELTFIEAMLADKKVCRIITEQEDEKEDTLLTFVRKTLVEVENLATSGR